MKYRCLKEGIFVINPDNGLWGLSKDSSNIGDLEKELNSTKFKDKKYSGTNIIVLNTTNSCNLDCLYCSVKKDRKYTKNLDLNVGKRAIDLSLQYMQNPTIVFHGSEPLENFETIKTLVLYGKQKAYKKEITFSLQTNLTLLKEDNFNFIKQNKIGISTSLDGPEKIHNITRSGKKETNSYQKTVEGIKRILDFQKGMNVVCVITKYNVKNLSEISLQFEDMGISRVQFTPIIPCSQDKYLLPTNQELFKAYISLFDQTISRVKLGKQKINITNLTKYLNTMFANEFDACRQCGASTNHPLLAIDTNGDVYPCDFFWGEKQTRMGNIMQDDFTKIISSKDCIRLRNINDTSCKDCEIKKICGGGCFADFYYSPKKHPYYCQTHKEVYGYLISKIPELSSQGLLTILRS